MIRVTGCVSVPHAIAAIALEMSKHSKPPNLHFGWPEHDLLRRAGAIWRSAKGTCRGRCAS